MSSPYPTGSAPASAAATVGQPAGNSRRALDALLREHRDAAIYALSTDGQIVPVPPSLGLDGYDVLASEGRSGLDLWVAEDRVEMVNAWMRVKRDAVTEVRGRLCSDPGRWMSMQMLDVRPRHGVVLHVLWPAGARPDGEPAPAPSETLASRPRFGVRRQDDEANVIDCDEGYLLMFGLAREEVVGRPTFDRVHPDDQARVIEGWVASMATGRVQMFRVRMRRDDGSWLWVDTTLHNYLSDPEQRCMLAECIDVSAEMSAQEALQDREELLRNLLEEMPDGLLQLDRERRVVYHNARLLEVLCVASERPARSGGGGGAAEPDAKADVQPADAPAPLELSALVAALTPDSRQRLTAALDRALAEGVRQDVEVEVALPFGQERHVLLKVRPLRRGSGVVTGVIASAHDVTDSARARRELERRATLDALTGAHNRASIMDALERELETSADTGVVFVDLDQFKAVNDTLGHAAGDEVLAHVAERLRGAMRASDELGRLGGDEFLVLLRGVSGLGVAMSAAQRISEAVRGTCELSCGSLELCASVGVACAEDAAVTAEQLVERADTAMYRSKEERRGIPVLAP